MRRNGVGFEMQACGLWPVTCGLWCVTCSMWPVTCDLWPVACGLWLVTCNLSQPPSSQSPSLSATQLISLSVYQPPSVPAYQPLSVSTPFEIMKIQGLKITEAWRSQWAVVGVYPQTLVWFRGSVRESGPRVGGDRGELPPIFSIDFKAKIEMRALWLQREAHQFQKCRWSLLFLIVF